MKYAVIYSSRTGNTAMLAETVREALGQEECTFFGTPDAAGEGVEEAEIIFAGFWTDKGNCSGDMAEFLKGLSGRKIFLFGTAGFGENQAYFDRILTNVRSHLDSSNTVVGTWMCQGKMPGAVRRRYEQMEDQQKAARMIANFDAALAHPSREDLAGLRDAVKILL